MIISDEGAEIVVGTILLLKAMETMFETLMSMGAVQKNDFDVFKMAFMAGATYEAGGLPDLLEKIEQVKSARINA